MNQFEEMTKAVTVRYSDRIKKLCSPLFESFPINYFGYVRIKNSGEYSYLGSAIAWSEFFAAEKLYLDFPYYRHPSFLNPGIHPLGLVGQTPLIEVLDHARSKFQIHPGILLIEKIPNGLELFGFFLDGPSDSKTRCLLNELPLLRIFVNKFKNDSFLTPKLLDNQVNLKEILGATFYERGVPLDPSFVKRKEFLQKMDIEKDFPLSPRELEVLGLYIGNSANGIADRLHISKRTVEHHLERIKQKLECNSKAELIEKARELETYGLIG